MPSKKNKNKKSQKQSNNNVLYGVIAILAVIGLGFLAFPKFYADERNQETVEGLVETFGKRMQYVNLVAENPDDLSVSMEEQYGKLIDDPLMLLTWMRNPQNAPGRQAYSPWPDRIEILSTEKISDTKYQVKGNIVEITEDNLSDECMGVGGVDTEIEGCVLEGFSSKRPITFVIEKTNHKGKPWLITEVKMGQYTITNEPNWQTTVNESQSFSYEYPSSLGTNFLEIKNLPPEVTATKNINSRLTCKTTKDGADLDKTVVKESINNNEYCITTEKKESDGESYRDYIYATVNEDYGLVEVKLAIQYPDCDKYEETEEREACKTEEDEFDLNSIVDKIVNSFKEN